MLRPLKATRDRTLGRILAGALAVPEPVLSRLSGAPRYSDRGVALDLQTQVMLAVTSVARRSPAKQTPQRARAEMRWQTRLVAGPLRPVHEVVDGALPGPAGPLPYRLYRPGPGGASMPVLVFFHGGGFVQGDLETHDAACRELAMEAGCAVISVDYRLAPEHPYPAAREDAVAAYRWVRAHAGELGVDARRIAVGGDSAGGNLATLVCLEARRAGDPPPVFQLLVYPATDLTRSCPSHQTFAEGYLLDAATMDWFLKHYLTSPEDATDPRCSPLFEGELGGLPPAMVVTAGFDPLRDEGEAYAHELRKAGTQVELVCEEGLIHGFLNMGAIIRPAQAAVRRVAQSLRRALLQ
jgi:acetyl esterase